MPKVSVIVPVYGVESQIERCARSLYHQSLDDIEFIFIDDCSPDKSMDLLEAITDEFRTTITSKSWTVRFLRMPSNSGQAAVRKYGLLLATGDFVIHCDSDDYVSHDMYRKMYEAAVSSEADIVVCDYVKTNGNSERLYRGSSGDTSNLIPEILIRKSPAALWNKLIRRQLLIDYPIIYPKGNMGEDFVLSLQLVTFAKGKIVYIPEPLYYYCENAFSITRNPSIDSIINKFNQVVVNVRIIEPFLRKEGLLKEYNEEWLYFKHLQRNSLAALIHEPHYRKIWFQTFSDINFGLLFSRYLSIRQRIKLLLTYLGIRVGL